MRHFWWFSNTVIYKDFSFFLPSFLSCIEIVFGVIPSGKSVMYKKAKPKIIHKIHTWTNGGTLCSFDVRSLTHGTTPSWSGIVTSSIPSLVSLTALWTTLTPLRPTWPASTHWKIRFVQFNWDTENCGEHAQNIALWIVLPLFAVHPLAAAVAKSPCKQLHSGDLITCCPRRQWVPKDRVFIDFSKGIKCARI